MIVLYTINSESKGEIIKTMLTNLKKKKIKQEFILLYCIDTKEVLKFTRHGKCDIVKTGIIPSIQVKKPTPLNTPILSRKFIAPMEVLSPSRHIDIRDIQRDDASDIDDDERLIFYNEDKELNCVYSCFYFKNQIIAVKPELYEKVKQEYDINQIIGVAEMFGIKEIAITKCSIKDKGITTGVSIESSGGIGAGATQSISFERTDYLNENKTLRLTYDLAKSKYIFYTMKEFMNILSKLPSHEIADLPISYNDLLRNVDIYRIISSRLEANMNSYDMDLKSVKKHNYGITVDASYLTKCGFKVAKHVVQFSRLKIKLEYFKTEDLIFSSNLILNRKCFEMIYKHSNLLNSYIENFLLKTAQCEFIKYKILKQIDAVKHNDILSRVKVFSDLDLTTGSLPEELRGFSPTTLIKCNEEGLYKMQELCQYISNFKMDPRLDDPGHDQCFNMRCSHPLCRCYQLETVQSWIIRVFNMNSNKMLLINSNNSKEFFYRIYRLIINLKHIPTYDKFVALAIEELTQFIENNVEIEEDDYQSVSDFPLR